MRIKVYDKNMIDTFNSLLRFDQEGDKIVVSGYKRPTRKTYHSIYIPFDVNMKTIKCKIRITPKAISIWEESNYEYSLFEIQNAVNILISSYQDITKEKVLEIISKK